ncbi:MAG TPA: insulinase family protein [Nitrospirae bacterium]|nr:insulinase family protein [Nitrospirota bacterium]
MFRKEYLDNKIPVLMERIKGVRSVCLGIWVKVGSRYETSQTNGISHFLEHMLFKGTNSRSQKEIAVEIDSLGGDLNAYTSKETTTFYIKLLDDYLERGIDLLMDIFLHSRLPEDEIEKEKGIVIEEIKMVEDTPDDYIHDLFSEYVWNREGIGLGILGTKKTVMSFTKKDLVEHIKKHYTINNIVISCAGNIEHEEVLKGLNSSIGTISNNSQPHPYSKQRFHHGTKVVSKDCAEVHLCIGTEGIAQGSPERYAMLLMNTVIGAGVSSRLFQEIREQRGLAYSVYSYTSSYHDSGLFGVYVGTGRKKYQQVIDIIKEELVTFKDTVSEDELTRAKKQLKGNLVLALESTSGRMNNLARQEIYYGKHISPSEIIKAIDGVRFSEVRELSDRLFTDRKFALTVLGPVKNASV